MGYVQHLRKGLTGVALAGTLAFAPLAAGAETLTDALITAYRHSHILDQQRALLRAADEDVAIALADLRPIIAFSAGASASATSNYELGATVTLSASMTLFDNGATRLGVEVQKEAVLATREALVNYEQQVLLAAVQAYMDVTSASESLALARSNVRLTNQQLRAARDRFEVGEVTRTEVAQAEAQLAAARSSEAAAQGSLEIARESYRVAVGSYPNGLAPPPAPPKLPASVDAAQAVAVRTHPLIRQAQHTVAATELGIKQAQAAMKFTVDTSANLSFDDQGNDRSSFGLTMNQPIYAGGKLSATLRKARNQHEANRAALLSTTHNVQQLVGNAWANLRVAVAQLQATDQQIRAATVAFRGVQEEQNLGAATTLDVLDAQQDLLDAQSARIDAQSQQYVALYSLLSAMGLLTVEHLGLGIQTYDPAAYYNAVKSAPVQRSKQGRQLDKVLERLQRQ
ncbi:TolC family outer membrane protein [Oceanicola sp. 502str15]|uniref:TolC family outer membrane protein n=1 Tax=Oceanicola sp. 502str15 TaxID=2696061 RepID=UPI0020954E62|nr:TolC family outer membrane protein [Oceanicola sp. 502str15]MCO6383001.1 TolC family outer membrane protein [Oceanicola sp. 502str15]